MIEFRTDSKWRMLLLLAIAVVFRLNPASPTAEAAPGDIYCVASDGDDSNPGTIDQPWRTIQKAANSIGAGDTVYVKQGVYSEQVFIASSGTESSPIAFIGLNYPTVESGQWTGISITGSHVLVQGFELRDATAFGIVILAPNVVVKDNIIHHNYHEGIRVSHPASNVLIKGGKICDNGGGNSVGLWIEGAVNDLTVEDVEFYSTGVQAYAINAWEADDSSRLTLRNLFIHDHPSYGASIFVDSDATLTAVLTHVHVVGGSVPKKLDSVVM